MSEEEQPKPTAYTLGADLSDASVEDLQEIIEALKTEARRVETAMEAKSAHLNAAQALFKS